MDSALNSPYFSRLGVRLLKPKELGLHSRSSSLCVLVGELVSDYFLNCGVY